MSQRGALQLTEHEFFEQLFRNEYQSLLRLAKVALQRYGAESVSVSGRAEEVVQETFQLAWRKRGIVMALDKPMGWLCLALVWKTREAIREDKYWVKRLSLIEQPRSVEPKIRLESELREILTQEEFTLLKRLYLEGYTYRELCDEFGEKKSTLAMRVKRSKDKLQKFL